MPLTFEWPALRYARVTLARRRVAAVASTSTAPDAVRAIAVVQ
jgi:hypothetical protein